MKRLTMSIVLLMLVGTAWAQRRANQSTNRQQYYRSYDTTTVKTIEGEVVDISYNPSQQNASVTGVHMLVKTDTATLPVHLGPQWYMVQQEPIRKGDRLTITGSLITFNGAPTLIAATIQRNQMILVLRNRSGYPVWRGWRRGRRINR